MPRLAVLTAVLLGLYASPAMSATITVKTTQDVPNNNGQCSLREAVTAANMGTAFGACPAGDQRGTRVVLGAGHYVLTGGQLPVTTPITVVGQEGATVIDALGLSRVFEVGVTGDFTLSGLTLTNGRAPDGASATTGVAESGGSGGAVKSMGALTLDHVAVVGNRAGNGGAGTSASWGAQTGGDGGDGGGIESGGPLLTIVDSTIADNSAGTGRPAAGRGGNGGGIDITGGSVSITGSTISGNAAGDSDPQQGLFGIPGGAGGGLALANPALGTLANDTIVNNAAGHGGQIGGSGAGAIYQTGGRLTLTHVTVAGNTEVAYHGAGGSISTIGGLVVANSALEGSCSGPVTDGGHNFTTIPTNYQFNYHQVCPGRQLPDAAFGLGPLQNNGGPTQTMLPAPGSPLIGAVPRKGAGCLASDQRGVTRPQGPACDAGAVEVRVPVIAAQRRQVRFGSTFVGHARRVTVRLRITAGELPLRIGRAQITGRNARDFAVVKNRYRGKALNPGQSCTLVISFRPRAPGLRTAKLTLNVRIPGKPVSITLAGTGMP